MFETSRHRRAHQFGVAVAAILFLFGAPTFILAGSKKTEGSQESQPTLADRITALDLTSITVTLTATHRSEQYRLAPATKITVNGAPATSGSLAVGMDVQVTPSADPAVAAEVVANSPKPSKREPPKKKH